MAAVTCSSPLLWVADSISSARNLQFLTSDEPSWDRHARSRALTYSRQGAGGPLEPPNEEDKEKLTLEAQFFALLFKHVIFLVVKGATLKSKESKVPYCCNRFSLALERWKASICCGDYFSIDTHSLHTAPTWALSVTGKHTSGWKPDWYKHGILKARPELHVPTLRITLEGPTEGWDYQISHQGMLQGEELKTTLCQLPASSWQLVEESLVPRWSSLRAFSRTATDFPSLNHQQEPPEETFCIGLIPWCSHFSPTHSQAQISQP